MSNHTIIAVVTAALCIFAFLKDIILKKEKSWEYILALPIFILSYFYISDLKAAILFYLTLSIIMLIKNRKLKKYLQEWFPCSLLLLGYVYRDYSIIKELFIALFVITKTFHWPINFIEKNDNSEEEALIIGFFAPFILWLCALPEPSVFWTSVWVSVAIFFSFGSTFKQCLLAIALALISQGESYGVLGLALSMAVFIKEKFNTAYLPILALAGVFIFQKNILENEAAFVLPVLLAISIARLIVSEIKTVEKVNIKEQSANIFILLTLATIFSILEYKPDIQISMEAITFMVALPTATGIFFYIYNKYPKILISPKGVLLYSWFYKKIALTEKFQIKKYEELNIKEFSYPSKIIEVTKSGAFLITLVAVLCLMLFLGGK